MQQLAAREEADGCAPGVRWHIVQQASAVEAATTVSGKMSAGGVLGRWERLDAGPGTVEGDSNEAARRAAGSVLCR